MEDQRRIETSSSLGTLFDFSFRRFITVDIIKVLYALILVLIALGWLLGVISAFGSGFLAGLVGLVLVTIAAIIQVIFARVWLEIIVVIFRIGENTSILAERERPLPPPAAETPPIT